MKGFILSDTVKEQHAVLLIMSVCVFKDHQLNYKFL